MGKFVVHLDCNSFSAIGMSDAGAVVPDFIKAQSSLKVLSKVLRREPAIPYKGGKTITNLRGNIKIDNITFVYPSRPEIPVLQNFSLDIAEGTSVALVGPSGSGKSTIVSLLERFYDPKEGNIYIDGVSVKELDPLWLHKNIAIVSQESQMFAASVRDNIAYAIGVENVSQEQIEAAARAANCHNFIVELPDGYDTQIGEKGVTLSGGQKQRLAIARAVLQDPQILLLDEATSALDSESEYLVQTAIDSLMKGRTTICVAHRLSTIQGCDLIYVLARGSIQERGKHSDLMKVDGLYRKMVQKQMSFGKQQHANEELIDTDDEDDIMFGSTPPSIESRLRTYSNVGAWKLSEDEWKKVRGD